MVEQVVYSLAFILLNISLYVFVLTKTDAKKKIRIVLLSLGFLAISFLIPFEPKHFYAMHNSFLIMFSLGIFMVRFVQIFDAWQPMSEFNARLKEKYFSRYFKIIPSVAALLVTVYQITTIWNPDLFPPDFP